MNSWVCLDCGQRWEGNAGEMVKEGRRKQLQPTEIGTAIHMHVITQGHSVVPVRKVDDDG